MLNLALGYYTMTNVSTKIVSCMAKAIPQSHDNKISKHFADFMISSTKLKFNNFWGSK